MILKAIIITCRILVCLCTLGAVKEATDKHAWPLITDLVVALFFAALSWCIGGVGL